MTQELANVEIVYFLQKASIVKSAKKASMAMLQNNNADVNYNSCLIKFNIFKLKKYLMKKKHVVVIETVR